MTEKNLEKWHVVYTRPRFEKKVAALFSDNGIENYCPLHNVTRKWHDRKKNVAVPLFTSYVFVRVSEKELWKAKSVFGVLNFVYWLGKPAIIKEEEIYAIKKFLEMYGSVTVSRPNFGINDKVKINSGLFVDTQGEIISIRGKQVQIQLSALNLTITANLETTDIQQLVM